MNNRDALYICHHGILGMRWGKQQGPPYPLNAEDHSAAEKKAGWRKSLDQDSNVNSSKASKKSAKSLIKSKTVRRLAEAGAVAALTFGAYKLASKKKDNSILSSNKYKRDLRFLVDASRSLGAGATKNLERFWAGVQKKRIGDVKKAGVSAAAKAALSSIAAIGVGEAISYFSSTSKSDRENSRMIRRENAAIRRAENAQRKLNKAAIKKMVEEDYKKKLAASDDFGAISKKSNLFTTAELQEILDRKYLISQIGQSE